MTRWGAGGNVFQGKGRREHEGEQPQETTDEEREEIGQTLRNRRLRSTIRGKSTYNKKPQSRKKH